MAIRWKMLILLLLLAAPTAGMIAMFRHYGEVSAERIKALNAQHLKMDRMAREAGLRFDLYLKEMEVAFSTLDLGRGAAARENLQAAIAALDTIKRTSGDRELANAVQHIVDAALHFDGESGKLLNLVTQGSLASSEVASLATNNNAKRINLTLAFRALEDERDAAYDQELAKTLKDLEAATYWYMGFALATLFGSGAFAYILMRSILKRIAGLQQHFAGTDLERLEPFPPSGANDELESLVSTANAMLFHMREARKKLLDMRVIESVFASFGDLLLIVGRQGRILRANSQAEKILGVTEDHLRHVEFLSLIDAQGIAGTPNDAQLPLQIQGKLNAREPFHVETLLRHAAGHSITAVVTGHPLQDESGSDAAMVISVRDVTYINTMRKEKEAAEREVAESAKLAALGSLGAGMAHEINNPLTAALGFAQSLKTQLGDAALVPTAERIIEAALRMQKIIEDFRVQTRQDGAWQQADLDIKQLVQTCLQAEAPRIKAADIALSLALETDDKPVVVGNAQELESALRHVLSNAVHALEDLGPQQLRRLQLGLRVQDENVVITVKDSGAGIEPQVKARLFEPFFTTKAPGRGRGLGLTMVHRVLSQHGGRVLVDSQAGAGTEVALTLPRKALAAAKLDGVEGLPEAAGTPMLPASVLPTCLVVDDEGAITELVELLLEGEFQVIPYNYPLLALKAVQNGLRPQVLLSDLRMPELDGLSLIAQIRELSPATSAAIMTGHGGGDEARRAKELGVLAFFVKPLPARAQLISQLSELANASFRAMGVAPRMAPTSQTTPEISPQVSELLPPKPEAVLPLIVLVDDDPDILGLMRDLLDSAYEILEFSDTATCLAEPRVGEAKLVVTDMHLGDDSGLSLISKLAQQYPWQRYLVVSGDAHVMDKIAAAGEGQAVLSRLQSLNKPFSGAELRARVAAGLDLGSTPKAA